MVFYFRKSILNFNKTILEFNKNAVADKPVIAFLCVHKTILTFNEKKGCECK